MHQPVNPPAILVSKDSKCILLESGNFLSGEVPNITVMKKAHTSLVRVTAFFIYSTELMKSGSRNMEYITINELKIILQTNHENENLFDNLFEYIQKN